MTTVHIAGTHSARPGSSLNAATSRSMESPSIDPKVSIIINNYNYGAFLPASIHSALAQTYANCEVIVVDDGSTDDSRDVLTRFSNRVCVLLQENAGQVAAFNAGFEKSSGNLIIFLDSDDFLLDTAIETVVRQWTDQTVAVQFKLEIINVDAERTGLLMPRADLPDGNEALQQLFQTGRYVWPPTSGNVYSRRFLESLFPIPQGEWEHGDSFINAHAPFYGRVSAIQSPLGFYRVHGRSMSSVTHGGSIDVAQLRKLLNDCTREEQLVRRIAKVRGVEHKLQNGPSRMRLKVELALAKLTQPSDRKQGQLFQLTRSMLASLFRGRELSLLRRMQFVIWTLSVAILPRRPAVSLIGYAFNFSPQSPLVRFFRRT